MVKFGNWVFHNRNWFFALFYATMFIPSSALSENVGVQIGLGLAIFLFGVMSRGITIGLEYIVRGGLYRQIYADKLVISGIYSICRNPMYFGNILILIGVGIFANSALFVFLTIPIFIFLYAAIILAEQSFLENKFGEEYNLYKQNVNAIIPDFTKIKEAFKGQKFNLKKVIRKEYNSFFLYLGGLLLLLLYQKHISLIYFLIIGVILLVSYLTIRFLKKKNMLG
ncbi:MAG: isoprenylcysteine carboxylmethyltransferase family protein [Bacteroidota bacterium]|nr:isoprenylcysteine carboxylmethyltransferase family protein [Bacteroidota bacterium]